MKGAGQGPILPLTKLTAQSEDISPLLDPVLQQMWSDHMYRIILTVKDQKLKGKIKYIITK